MDEGDPLIVFSQQKLAPPLSALKSALAAKGMDVSFSISAAGEAGEADMLSRDWEAVFIRWTTPELHDVLLLVKDDVLADEETRLLRDDALKTAHNLEESADRLILEDHLRRTVSIYSLQFLPAIIDDEEHPAWDAVDVLLRALATASDGLIYARGEGFFDEELEPLIATIMEDDEIEENE